MSKEKYKLNKLGNYPAAVINLLEFPEIIIPFTEFLLENEERFKIGDDNETGKDSIWDESDYSVILASALFDDIAIEYLDKYHPEYKGQGKNYELEKDGGLNCPQTWQGYCIHRHVYPFLKPHEVGDIVTVFYPVISENASKDNGSLAFYPGHSAEREKEGLLFLPASMEPDLYYVPKQYDLIMFTAWDWHRAMFSSETRYSLATDIKIIK